MRNMKLSEFTPLTIDDPVFGVGQQSGDGLVRWTATVPVDEIGDLLVRWDARLSSAWPNGSVTVRSGWAVDQQRVAIIGALLPVHLVNKLV